MQCQKKKRDGSDCRARALSGRKYCALHADSGKARELDSKGGRRRARYNLEGLMEFAALKNAADLRDLPGAVNGFDSTGTITALLYGNGVITCGNNTISATRWCVTYYTNNSPGPSCDFNITGSNWNLDSAVCARVAAWPLLGLQVRQQCAAIPRARHSNTLSGCW
jgi:hypothetical protein